jgi:hypothetical protein
MTPNALNHAMPLMTEYAITKSRSLDVFRIFGRPLVQSVGRAVLAALVLCGAGCSDDNDLQPVPPVGLGPSPVTPPSTSRQLSIEPVFQATPQWCWAATAEMVFRHYGLPTVNPVGHYQCGIIGVAGAIGVLPPVCNLDCSQCIVPISTAAGYTAILQQYPAAVRATGRPARNIAVENRLGPLAFAELTSVVDSGTPIITGINPSGIPNQFAPEHAALLIGYIATGAVRNVIINDPFPYGLGPLGPFGDPYIRAGGRLIRPGQYEIAYSSFVQFLVWNYSLIAR